MKLPSYLKITKGMGMTYDIHVRKWHPGFWRQLVLSYLLRNKK